MKTTRPVTALAVTGSQTPRQEDRNSAFWTVRMTLKALLAATSAFMMIASPVLAQTTVVAPPTQCNFTPAPAVPDGATATNTAMQRARDALETWRATRQTELAACNSAAQTLQAQAQAAAAAHNAAATEADATITRFIAENTEYNARGAAPRRDRGNAPTRPAQ